MSKSKKRDGSGTVYDKDAQMHGVDSVLWSNLGVGWVVWCLCHWTGTPEGLLEDAGYQFDEHLREVGLLHDDVSQKLGVKR